MRGTLLSKRLPSYANEDRGLETIHISMKRKTARGFAAELLVLLSAILTHSKGIRTPRRTSHEAMTVMASHHVQLTPASKCEIPHGDSGPGNLVRSEVQWRSGILHPQRRRLNGRGPLSQRLHALHLGTTGQPRCLVTWQAAGSVGVKAQGLSSRAG